MPVDSISIQAHCQGRKEDGQDHQNGRRNFVAAAFVGLNFWHGFLEEESKGKEREWNDAFAKNVVKLLLLSKPRYCNTTK